MRKKEETITTLQEILDNKDLFNDLMYYGLAQLLMGKAYCIPYFADNTTTNNSNNNNSLNLNKNQLSVSVDKSSEDVKSAMKCFENVLKMSEFQWSSTIKVKNKNK
jgi:hypothetical protein